MGVLATPTETAPLGFCLRSRLLLGQSLTNRKYIMPSRFLCALLLGSSLFFSAALASAAPTIQLVVPTFDYPGGNYHATIARGVANDGTVVGTVDDGTPGTRLGFERFADGSFSAPFAFPGWPGTIPRAVNNSNLICGSITGTFGTLPHGFFYDGVTFTQYDLPGATTTSLTGLNDAGDFCGYSTTNGTAGTTAFVNIGGALVIFTLPGVTEVYPEGVNNLGQVAGYYLDPNIRLVYHGFFRDTDGTLTFPLDHAHSASTQIFGLNDHGYLAGAGMSSGNVSHGFVLKLPQRYVSFDYADSEFGPTFSGINNSGLLPGYYFQESDLDLHSFIAQLVR